TVATGAVGAQRHADVVAALRSSRALCIIEEKARAGDRQPAGGIDAAEFEWRDERAGIEVSNGRRSMRSARGRVKRRNRCDTAGARYQRVRECSDADTEGGNAADSGDEHAFAHRRVRYHVGVRRSTVRWTISGDDAVTADR